mmetsp:Transcript_30753/g.95146  ORF Transcript_30753/g.95146 Transcript_30753/m.95146 type:complete len:186 (+) Transcript_30753:971-1528(+)
MRQSSSFWNVWGTANITLRNISRGNHYVRDRFWLASHTAPLVYPKTVYRTAEASKQKESEMAGSATSAPCCQCTGGSAHIDQTLLAEESQPRAVHSHYQVFEQLSSRKQLTCTHERLAHFDNTNYNYRQPNPYQLRFCALPCTDHKYSEPLRLDGPLDLDNIAVVRLQTAIPGYNCAMREDCLVV